MPGLCTYFDQNYLPRGLALYRSLRRAGSDWTLWVLCLDDATFRMLTSLGLPGLVPIRLADLERADPDLLATQATRSRIEYYFTLTPALPRYLLTEHPELDVIAYVDADMMFFSDPAQVIDLLGSGSVGITPHGFPDHLRHLEKYGRFNVGMVTFRNDAYGRACLERWRERCLEWCYDRVEDGRFADQAYLDDWPEVHQGVVVIDRPGVGLGPWNFMRWDIDVERDLPLVDGQPLVFYHYHAFRSVGRWLYFDGLAGYGTMIRRVRRFLYGGYIRELRSAARDLDRFAADRTVAASTRGHARITAGRLIDLVRNRRLILSIRDWVLGLVLATSQGALGSLTEIATATPLP